MTELIFETLSEQKNDFSLRLENSQMIDVGVISESVVCAAEYIVSSLSQGLPKSVYQLALFNLLKKQGFKLQTQKSESQGNLRKSRQKEIIIVNEKLVIECLVQEKPVSDTQRRLMFDYDNNSVAGIIVNFGDCYSERSITKVYQNSVLH